MEHNDPESEAQLLVNATTDKATVSQKKTYFRKVLSVTALQMLFIVCFIGISFFSFVNEYLRNKITLIILGALILLTVVFKEWQSEAAKRVPTCYIVSAIFSFLIASLIAVLFDHSTQPTAFYFFGSFGVILVFSVLYDLWSSEEPNQGDLCKVLLSSILIITGAAILIHPDNYVYVLIVEAIVLVIYWAMLGLFIGDVDEGLINTNEVIKGTFLLLFR